MKKFIFLIIVLLLLTSLFGISEFACIFTMINPSATDVAFGLGSGAANIWNTSPLSVWSNPAKLRYHNGFAFEQSDDPWFEKVFSDMNYHSSYISYGWKGIGILIPAPSAKNHWGTFMEYGEYDMLDEYGNVIGTYESYDSCSKFAIGIDAIKFLSDINLISPESKQKMESVYEISTGVSVDFLRSTISPEGTTEGFSSSIGCLGRYSPYNKLSPLGRFYTLDVVGGIVFVNPFRFKIKSPGESKSDPLPWGTHPALSSKISIIKDLVPNLQLNPFLDNIVDNLLSLYVSYDYTLYGDFSNNNTGEHGYGYEITLLNIFSIRNGMYNDENGDVIGNTFGYGINLNYKDIFQLQYNFVKFPAGGYQKEQEKTDYMIRIDFLRAYGLFL